MAILSTDKTKILNNYCMFTGVPFNATVVTKWSDGSEMSDAKVDNAIYFKVPESLGGGYAKRDVEGHINVKWFGAKGDGINDDYPAIQAAIDKAHEGATQSRKIFFPAGHYLVSDSIRMKDRVSIFGESPGGFPYFAADENQTIIEARFGLNQDRYIIDSYTKDHDGNFYPVDAYPTAGDLFTNPINQFLYDIHIEHIYLCYDTTSPDKATFGGVRLIGTPTSVINVVGILGTKIGYTLVSQWGSYISKCSSLTHWHAVILANDMNGNHVQGYFNRMDVSQPLVKSSLIAAPADIEGVYRLDPIIATSYIGILMIGNVRCTTVDAIIEHWNIGVLELDAIGTFYTKLYLEGGVLRYAVASAYSTSNIQSFQCYSTNPACYGFDFGYKSRSHINATGLLSTQAGFIKKVVEDANPDNDTRIVVDGISRNSLAFKSDRIVFLYDLNNDLSKSSVKAKINIATPAVAIPQDAVNISNVIREAAGIYTFYFTNHLPNVNYLAFLSVNDSHSVAVKDGDGKQTYSTQVYVRLKATGVLADPNFLSLVVM